MIKVESYTEYSIEIPDEDMDILKKAKAIVNSIAEAMEKYDCEYIEGGYADGPETMDKGTLLDIYDGLINLTTIYYTKMY